MKVFLLGAGASKSYSQSPTDQKMPIARDFFQTFDKLDISSNPWVLQHGLVGYLMEKGVRDPHSYLRKGIDIEELHSEIEEVLNKAIKDGLDFPDYLNASRAYTELTFIFTSVINEIQNGPVSKPHRHLARLLEPDDAVITFNWDILLDRALEVETDWRVDWGYGVKPRGIFSDGWRNPGKPDDGSLSPRLIKLHGSTNWITGYTTSDEDGNTVLSHSLDPSTLHIFESATESYPCYAGRYMHGYEAMSYGYYPPNLAGIPGRAAPEGRVFVSTRPKFPWVEEGSASETGLVSMPLIIPPVRAKKYELFGKLFAGLWKEAEDLLALADEIVIIGYSFPRTDIQSSALFRKAFSRRSSMPRITIIDPAPQNIAENFQIDLGILPKNLNVFADYFSEMFDLAAALKR